ncbi:MAG: hypothetical protein HKN21_10090 [Candidatus Eisenbacteria bacterium]|uniref:Uncharacterized protein n=1 Tax=Eiseniibacteriota bacterium TaxID=2212470 RepID=A0A7Y2H2H4_UNCEI|nr:hypothetical protein [Candidatus Eisenbacteria bacterium]
MLKRLFILGISLALCCGVLVQAQTASAQRGHGTEACASACWAEYQAELANCAQACMIGGVYDIGCYVQCIQIAYNELQACLSACGIEVVDSQVELEEETDLADDNTAKPVRNEAALLTFTLK